jgi:hypothetical protein
MSQFLIGVATGIWLGTMYDFKPIVEQTTKIVKENFPKEKDN